MIDHEKFEDVPFDSLAGEHELDAVDESTEQVKRWYGDQFEDANCIRFRLDGKVYTGIEDPSDGYRSSMQKLFVSTDHEMKNVFPPVKVLASIRTKYEHGGSSNVLELRDAKNGRVILAVGTENDDDYYPWFLASWMPGEMAVNRE